MNLFSKEKEIILKIINAILVVWILIASVVIVNNLVYIVVKDPEITYEEYKLVNCSGAKKSEILLEDDCQAEYKSENINNRLQNYYYYRSIIICLAQILIVGGTLYLFNKFDLKYNKEVKKENNKKTVKKIKAKVSKSSPNKKTK